MRVIILAAGKGERLRPLTEDRPKCLIEAHPGVAIIDLQLRSIATVPEIESVVVVTGYRASQVDDHLARGTPVPVKTIYNPFYDISNDMVSLWTAIRFMGEPFIVLNGDDVFAPKVIADLVAAEGDICAVIDQKPSYDTDDMKVELADGRLTAIGKDLAMERAQGESIGMIRFKGHGQSAMSGALERLLRTDNHRSIHWLAAIQMLIDEGERVDYSLCVPEHWAEIDIHFDLDLVKSRLNAAQHMYELLQALPPQAGP
jgi:choline kinase